MIPKFQVIWQLVRQLVYRLYYTRYQVFFYLWRIGHVLIHCKVPKYHDQNSLKTFFLLSSFPVIIQISRKSAHLVQTISSIKKLPIS